ncbi:putative TonB-dependent receptor [Methylococcus capsulatus]|jgi:iron complex outermembrane receptor protein|uniref:TonB-dependent receptor n=1 Tax=Methylococcus capsulatus TaxID=414 RepID=A0AA35UNW3_METCP|nr:TonB-dependent receptor [Methylococcus capsulatus]CAI8766015.1 putative TonB-dependent receptor [Methylococcus capsulatus]
MNTHSGSGLPATGVRRSRLRREAWVLAPFLFIFGSAGLRVGSAEAAEDVVELDKITVYGEEDEVSPETEDLPEEQLEEKKAQTMDTASLFKDVPGVSLYTGGGVSSLPAIHGMADDRVKILVNGMNITSACSNHMNPALSYVAPASVGKASIMAGVTPVSQGGDSIGGTISVDPAAPSFAKAGQMAYTGKLGGMFRSNSDTFGNNFSGSIASEDFAFDYGGSWAKGNNYMAGNGGPTVLPTRYLSTNMNLRASTKLDNGFLSADVTGQYIPYQGFPNQRMDVAENTGLLGGFSYENSFDWGKLDARVYYHSTWHLMDLLPDRKKGNMPMKADGSDLGYRVRAHLPVDDVHTVRVGSEYFQQGLQDWWPGQGMHMPQDFLSINDGQRNRLGTFAEWEANWNKEWLTQLGVRNDMVWMNTGRVQGYDNGAFYSFWATPFNAANRSRVDHNFDVTATTAFTPDANSRYELGLSRKQRSPNLYERYAWAGPNSMITWFGDGNSYLGNLDLKPEAAYTATFTANWHDERQQVWSVSLTPYYTRVNDYIYGQKVAQYSNGFHGMQFVNLSHADMYGGDFSARYAFLPESPAGSFAAKVVAAYVRGVGNDGQRSMGCPYVGTSLAGLCNNAQQFWPVNGFLAPTSVNLYHMMPLNATVSLEHSIPAGSAVVDSAISVNLVDSKTAVAQSYAEPTTPGYVLLNLRTSYQREHLRVDVGADNLLNKLYYHPLGGVDIVESIKAQDVVRLPAIGRSVYVSLNLEF